MSDLYINGLFWEKYSYSYEDESTKNNPIPFQILICPLEYKGTGDTTEYLDLKIFGLFLD